MYLSCKLNKLNGNISVNSERNLRLVDKPRLKIVSYDYNKILGKAAIKIKKYYIFQFEIDKS